MSRLASGMALLSADDYREFVADKSDKLDLKAQFAPHRDQAFRATETRLRKIAQWKGGYDAWPGHRMLGDYTYINVGHSHLEKLGTFRDAKRRVVWLHDDIPLRLPNTQTERAVARFRDQVTAVRSYADHVVTPAQATARDVATHLGEGQKIHSIWPGIERPKTAQPFQSNRPYFAALGTIEPRKNLELLLDIWPKIDADLRIVGRVGWKSDAIIERINETPRVYQMGALSDQDASAVVKGALALLFPSLAEGFGLPLLEARSMGTPVIASNIPVFHEISDASVRLLDPNDPRIWEECISTFAISKSTRDRSVAVNIPSWETHFAELRPVLNGMMDQ